MLKLFKKFLFTALRIFAIVFVISLCLINLNRCSSESKDETITVLGLNTTYTVKEHVDDIPVKTIVSNSNVEEDVDIVHFGTKECFEKYSEEFEILESTSVHKKIPLSLYLPTSIYYNNGTVELSFDSLIDGIINNKNWSDIIKYAAESPILLNYDVSNEAGYAFYTLLFDYFSGGRASNKLTVAERDEVIHKMESFVKEHPSTIISGNNKDSVASFSYLGVSCIQIFFSKDVVLETKFSAVSENGKKYLEDITEQYLNGENLVNQNLVSCESMDVINTFMETDVTPFEHRSKMDDKVGEIFIRAFLGIAGFIIACIDIIYLAMDDEEPGEFHGDLIAGSIFTVFACIFSPYVPVFIGGGIGWLIFALWCNEWYSDCEEWLLVAELEREKRQDEKDKATQERLYMLKKLGEGNPDDYNKVLGEVDKMIKYNENLGVNNDIWKNIKQFLMDDPSSISRINGLFDASVRLMLEVLDELPKDGLGNIKSDFDELDRIKNVLSQINQVTSDNFKDKKKWHHMHISTKLSVIEERLKGNIKIK